MTPEERRREILAQPGAMKEVYGPDQDTVNGHVIVRGQDAWHLIYGSQPGSQNTVTGHATSDDLVVWTKQEPILRSGAPGDCDAQEIADRCVVEHEGRWYMVYQCTPSLGASRRFALAVSDDLWHWEKLPGDGSHVFTPDPGWSGWTEEGVLECKDPWIIRHEGRFLMYFSCQNRWGDSCLALAESEDLVHWEDRGPLMTVHRIENPVQGPSAFEVPRVVMHDGKYYLFVMNFWGLEYAVSDDPFHFGPRRVLGPWHAPIIFSDDRDRWFITHALRPFGKPSTKPPLLEPLRGLYIGGLVWSEGVPVPVDLGDVLRGLP